MLAVTKLKLLFICLLVLTLLSISAYATVDLGTAASFAVLAGTPNITNTGTTTITGNVGIAPAASITGKGPGADQIILTGAYHEANAVALTAKNDLTTAYDILAGMTPTTHYSIPTDLGGLTLTQGVYKFDSSAGLTGTLKLSGPGDFVFQIVSTLITESDSNVLMIDGADAGNVYWQVGSSATLKTGTAFKGSILALTSIDLNTGATIESGRALARNGAVTLDSNIITVPVPEPATIGLLGLGTLAFFRKRKA